MGKNIIAEDNARHFTQRSDSTFNGFSVRNSVSALPCDGLRIVKST